LRAGDPALGAPVIKQISAVVIFAALVAVLIGVLTWPGEAQQRTPTLQGNVITASAPPVFDQSYTAGMRIIQVPQGGVVASRAVPKASYQEQVDAIDDDVEPPPPPHHRAAPTAQQPQPRRVLPPPNAAKRTMLNPPSSLHDGPSPIRPTPRWRGIEKFTELPKQVRPAAPVADPIVAPIPTQSSAPIDSTTAASASDMPAGVDDDTPPPTD
jgi:hypothetical protein